MNAFGYLKRVPLFADFGPKELRLLQRISLLRTISRGQEIFDESSFGDRLYIVIAGQVKIFASNGKRKKTLAYLEKGEFFGEMSLLDQEPRSASSIATDDGALLVIKKKDFKELLLRHPRLSFCVMKTLSRRLRHADREIESLVFGNVPGRIASTLLSLSGKYGEHTSIGSRIKMPFSHKDLAELTGTGREMVSRILSRLRRLGCITYTSQDLTITDAGKLKRFIY